MIKAEATQKKLKSVRYRARKLSNQLRTLNKRGPDVQRQVGDIVLRLITRATS